MHSARTAMSDDLNTEIRISADPSGVETGMRRAKQSIADLAAAAATAGEQGGKSMQKIGAGGEAAARTMDGVTKNMVSSLQRQIAALESGGTATRQYQESIARLRGANLDTLKPYLDQLDAAKAKAATAAHAQAGLETRLGSMGTVASVVSGQLMALTASLSMGAMAAFVLRINDGLDALNDVKDATGSTIESISALEDVALRSGGSLDVVTTSLVKLNDVLLKAKPGSDAEQALRSIGLQATELRRLDPAEALRQVAVALSGYADDQNKARLVQELFGKSLREMAPFLADLAEKTTLVGKVTTEQAAAAERFNKQLFDIKTTAADAGRAMVKDMLPGLNQIATAMAKGAHEGGLLLGVYRGLAEFGSIAMGTDDLGNATRNAQTAQAEMVRIQARMQDLQTALDRDPGNANAQRRMALLRAELEAVQKMATRASEAVKKVVGQPVESAEESPAKPQVLYSPGEDQAKADAAKQAAEALRRELAEQAKIMAELHGLSGGFADDWARLSRMYADGALSLDQLTQAQAELLAKQPAIRAAQEAEKRVLEDMAKATLEAAKAREGYIASLQAGADKLLADVQAQQEAADRMGLSRQAVAELDAAKLEMLATDRELQASKELDRNLDMQAYEALMAQAKAYRELANAKRTGAARETAVEEAKKAADEWQRTSDQINQSLTDALMRGFESGKDFAKNLRDTVVNMFKTMVLRPVISAVVNPVAGALTGALGFAGTASAATGAASGGSGIGSIVSAGSSIYSALTTGVSNSITSAFSKFATSSVGTSLGLSTPAVVGNNPSAYVAPQLSSAGSAIGTGLGMLGSGLAGYGLSSMISGGYTTGGNTVNVLSGIASAFFGPLAGVAGGLINRAFGRKLKDVGIEGTLGGAEGFEGQQYQFYKGGWFRSDKTKYQDLDPTTASGLAQSFKAIQGQVGAFATVLGLETDRIAGFTTQLKVSTKGLDDAGIAQAFQAALATGSNELAQQVLGTLTTTTREVTETLAGGMGDWGDGTMQAVTRTIEETTYAASEYAREGEKAIDTLTRLATSLSGVNTIWDQLGNTLLDASLAGADAASRIADAFGGLEAMAQATGAYFQNFYSAEEQRAAVERQLNEALGKLNLQLPDIDATDARAQYRALAEAQDRNTEAGRKAYVVLLQLSGAFASVTAESETAAAAAARLADEQAKAAEAADRAAEEAARRAEEIARERYGLETQLMQLLGDTAGLRKREIEALDASNRALQEHIYAIEDARAAYEKSITAAQSAYSVLESSVGRDRSALQSALDAERDAINARYKLQQDGHAAQLSAAQSAADKMRGIASMLSGALGRMVVESPALDRARLQSARGVIGAAAASSNVMAPGLEAALSVVTDDVRKMYGRWEDFAFDRGVTAGQTAALSSAAQSQLSGYESIVNALKAQDDVAKQLADAEIAAAQERFEIESKKLDERLEQGKSMLDRLLGIEEGTLSSVEALARLTDAVNASNAALRAQKQAEAAAAASSALSASAVQAVGGVPGRSYTDSELASMGFDPADIKAGFAASLSAGGGGSREGLAAYVDRILLQGGDLLASTVGWNPLNNTDASGKKYSDAKEFFSSFSNAQKVAASEAFTNGAENDISDIELRAILGIGASAGSQLYSASGSLDFLDRLARGVNGSHANGLAYVPFDGYRAELHKGERVLTQDEARVYTPPAVVASMLRSGGASDGEILAELRVMRQRLEAIEAAANATAGATVGTKRALDRVVDSDALRTRETP